jgi:hypothetical protein
MDDLTKYFPNTDLTTEEIRFIILSILKTDRDDLFCFKCFKLIHNKPLPKQICGYCFRVYCNNCSILFKFPEREEIDPNKCIQCLDTRQYY